MGAPLLDLGRQNGPLTEGLKEAFERVLRSNQFILGAELESFEKEAAGLTGAKHALGVSSGTDAILLALMALGIGPGDEVICPSFTFFATAGCIARVGATPVFADSQESDFNLDPGKLAGKMTARTKAIMPVHLYGQCADMEPILALAKTYGIPVIEDAAQAIGARYNGKLAGSMGTFGAYSFFPTKNLGGFGDSGLLVTNDDELAEKAKLLRVHGAKPKYYHQVVGANFRMDAMQAALLRVKVPHYNAYVQGRERNAAHYLKNLADTSLALPSEAPGRNHTWNQFTIRVGNGQRDRVKEKLQAAGVGTEIYYPVPLHRQECFAKMPSAKEHLPVAEKLAKEVLSLPIFPELREEELDSVVSALRAAV